MKANSQAAINNPGSAWGTNGYNAQNKALAEKYYQLTGQKIVQDSNYVWHYDNVNGSVAYTVNKNAGTTTAQSGSAPYAAPSSGTFKTNSTGESVAWIQWALSQLGYSVPITKQFGPTTTSQVTAFQKANGLGVDGIVGSQTLSKLKTLLKGKLGYYHTGGIVDGTGAINDSEVLAVLKRGELVLNDGQKKNLGDILTGLKSTVSSLMSGNLFKTIGNVSASQLAPAGGDTFAPSFDIHIVHSGDMTDKDAEYYGRRISDVALVELKKAFDKRGIK